MPKGGAETFLKDFVDTAVVATLNLQFKEPEQVRWVAIFFLIISRAVSEEKKGVLAPTTSRPTEFISTVPQTLRQ